MKEPVSSSAEAKEEPADENKSLEETLHTVDLSSEDELPHDEEALEDSTEEKMEESRAEKIKRSGLRKVDSLKKAFSRQNIEKKMNQLGTKIVSVERREKIKKSLTSNHQKVSSGKSSPFKVSPLTFGRKKVREGESPAENETKSEELPSSDQMLNDHEESSFAEGASEASLNGALVEGQSAEGDAARAASRGSNTPLDSNVDLTIVEDEEEESVALEQAQKVRYEGGYVLASEEAEQSDEERVQPAVLQVDQTAWAPSLLRPHGLPAGGQPARETEARSLGAVAQEVTNHYRELHARDHDLLWRQPARGAIANLSLGLFL